MNIKSIPISNEQLQQWGPKLASVLLVIAIAYTLTQLVWNFAGTANSTHSMSPKTSTAQVKSTQKQAAKFATSITTKHLFGQADVQAPEQVISAPETKLNLKLMGILAIGEKDGLAIIASGGNKQEVYKIGDRIPGNVSLKAVYADRVIFEGRAGLETLMLPKDSDLVKFEESATDAGGKQARIENKKPDAKILSDYRKQLSRYPAEMQKLAKMSPATENGKTIGVKLQPGANAAMYRALGLKDGDVVVSVNGIDLSKPENRMRAMQKLRRAKQINATILRDGQEIQINHTLN